MDKIDICYAFIEIPDASLSAMALRGFLGYLFIEDTEFHHHSDNPYHYPLVQYKRVQGRLLVMGLKDYADVVMRKVSTIDHLTTPGGRIKVQSIDVTSDSFQPGEVQARFKFATPWVALNEGNYQKFALLQKSQRKEFLEKILVGNILSALKGLSIFAKFRIVAELGEFKSIRVHVHGNQFQAFNAVFTTNVNLPRFFGLGKSVSKGFGAVEPVDT